MRADELPETVAAAGETCEARTLDVSKHETVRAVVREIETRAGAIDILVNNAGGVLGQAGRPLEEVEEADWQAIVAVNMTGAFLMSQASRPE